MLNIALIMLCFVLGAFSPCIAAATLNWVIASLLQQLYPQRQCSLVRLQVVRLHLTLSGRSIRVFKRFVFESFFHDFVCYFIVEFFDLVFTSSVISVTPYILDFSNERKFLNSRTLVSYKTGFGAFLISVSICSIT